MGEANHDTPCIKKIVWCSIRMSYRCASEHWVHLCPVLLLYLLFKFSPDFFAFLLSSSPVIICATLLLAVLISHGSTKLAEIDEQRKALADTSAPKSADVSRNIHCEAHMKFSVPSLKEKTISLKYGEIKEACFGRVRDRDHFQMDDSVPLLKGVYQENERADTFDILEETLTSTNSMVAGHQKVDREEFMEDNQERESKYTFPSGDKGGRGTNLFEAVNQSRVDENQTTCSMHSSSENVRQGVEMMANTDHGRGSPDSQRDEVRVVSEDRPAGTCKWGRAFSVRHRKKLSDIKIEAINGNVDNKLDSSLVGSPFGRVGISHGSLGSGSAQVDCTSPDTPTADIAPVFHEIDPLLSDDFNLPDPIKNCSDSHFCMPPQDPKIDGDSNDEADKSNAEENDEKNVGADPAFGSCDDEKNVMDLGYSEMERNRRLEILMAKRRSRKNIIFELDSDLIDVDNDQVCRRADEVVSHPVQVQTISVPKRNPFDIISCSDETEIPSSAPSILHRERIDLITLLSNQMKMIYMNMTILVLMSLWKCPTRICSSESMKASTLAARGNVSLDLNHVLSLTQWTLRIQWQVISRCSSAAKVCLH